MAPAGWRSQPCISAASPSAPRQPLPSLSEKPSGRRSPTAAKRAFTLIELVVTIGVIALLVVLATISLRAVRQSSRDASRLATLRAHVAVFSAYAIDFADSAPVFTRPSQLTPVRCCGWVVQHVPHFDAELSWHIALAHYYPANDFQDDAFYANTLLPRRYHLWTDFRYSSTFLTDPLFWCNTTRQGASKWKPQTLTNVTYPSLKGLLINFMHPDHAPGTKNRGHRLPQGLASSMGPRSEFPEVTWCRGTTKVHSHGPRQMASEPSSPCSTRSMACAGSMFAFAETTGPHANSALLFKPGARFFR